jgi:hypothetical protein
VALHPRRLLDILRNRLATRPITVLTGARQTGKTTLVRDLLPAAQVFPAPVGARTTRCLPAISSRATRI